MATDTQALSTAWQNAEKSGDYSQIAGLLGDLDGPQLMSVYGLSPADLNYINNMAGTSLMPISGNTLSNAAAAANNSATLTPDIAQNLMQRSMTTGVPTSEFDKYGGYDKVQSLYNQGNGTYALDKLDPAFLNSVDDIIANTGVGNLSVLKMTGQPLTKAGYQAMNSNGVGLTEADLKAMAIPYEGFLQTPKTTVSATNQTQSGAPTMLGVSNSGAEWPGSSGATSGGWNARQVVGASKGDLMGAGNANYNSSLIKSLRQNSMTPFSTNPGVQLAGSQGVTPSTWQPPTGQGTAFNPQVFNPRAATPQEINDYNAYSAYRSSSVGASQPYLSLTDWIARGRPSGVASTTATSSTTPPDQSGYGGGD